MPEIPKVPMVKPVLQLNKSDQLEQPIKEGWVWFFNSKKAHYVKGHRALCGRWLYLGSNYELGNDNSLDNCAECKRRLFKEREKEAKKLAKEGLVQ